MFNPLQIAEGYFRWFQYKLGELPPEIQRFAYKRFAICIACTEFEEKTDKCQLCNCDMKKKTLVTRAYCPMGMWKEENENTSL